MRPNQLLVFASSLLCLLSGLVLGSDEKLDERKPYIIYMGEAPSYAPVNSLAEEHHDLLVTAIGDEGAARASRLYSYGKSFNGFVASLLPHEAERLSDHDRIISVFESTNRELHTTRSWDFLGMTIPKTKRNPAAESNIIVGLLDTGIYPKAPSFNPKGYGPVPSAWKGKCIAAHNFTGCNNKIIGARFYNLVNAGSSEEEQSPIDEEGHGSHTSSIAAGAVVNHASLYGVAEGTARGGVPGARIAMYKVCWWMGCSDADILAAFDDAINDGVDIISMSVGGMPKEFFLDSIAIGSFHAMRRGIVTICSGGNDGPALYAVENVAPWIFTVAASSIDRTFLSTIKLGNGKNYTGFAINTFTPNKTMYPLTTGVLASNVTGHSPYGNSSACDYGTIDQSKVNGKIVYCIGSKGQDFTIQRMGGAGTVMSTDDYFDFIPETYTSATIVNDKDGSMIEHYARSTKNPQAVIYETQTAKMKAPSVASFSSRGPQTISPNILKPDVSAPGLHILAGYSSLAYIAGDRNVVFNILSGTSMACPHVSGGAAYVRTFQPKWSAAAIKSALMTTATPMGITDEEFGELSSGSGQINPLMAPHPGLIYDISPDSYIAFLCKEGYNETKISLLTGDKIKYNCSSDKPAQGTDGLNYPSMHTQLTSNETKVSAEFYRTVTNVGFRNSTYRARITSHKELAVNVDPSVLRFNKLGQQLSFKVRVTGAFGTGMQILRAVLEWNDGHHSVKSPILVFRS